jgi:hypothetical protein
MDLLYCKGTVRPNRTVVTTQFKETFLSEFCRKRCFYLKISVVLLVTIGYIDSLPGGCHSQMAGPLLYDLFPSIPYSSVPQSDITPYRSALGIIHP